ncbi:MAG: VOC family protein [Plesiomonas sp.]
MSTPIAWINELTDLSDSLTDFANEITLFAQQLGISVEDYQADHIAVRCNSMATADRWRNGFLRIADLLSEKQINGRPICLFSLHEPLQVGPWQIDCIELPYPGNKPYSREGWEHLELVVPSAAQTISELESAVKNTLSSLVAVMAEPASHGVRYKTSSPQAEDEQLANPTLAFSRDHLTLKIHPLSIRTVIENKKTSFVTN